MLLNNAEYSWITQLCTVVHRHGWFVSMENISFSCRMDPYFLTGVDLHLSWLAETAWEVWHIMALPSTISPV